MILEPGTFKVAEYRKAIPAAVKVQVILNYVASKIGGDESLVPSWSANDIEFDHCPALCDRPYDTMSGDFIPPQNDPVYIIAKQAAVHDEKTFGRKAGAAVTVTTRGSDVGERARTSDIRARQAVHNARLALKAGRQDQADEILAGARFKKKHTKPKSKIPQRKNPWGKRKLGNGGHNDQLRTRLDSKC